jgi:hypothetical protein
MARQIELLLRDAITRPPVSLAAVVRGELTRMRMRVDEDLIRRTIDRLLARGDMTQDRALAFDA